MFLNHTLTLEQDAKISVFDHGYLYGVGLFETFRTYQGEPFLVQRHMERLAYACREIGMLWEPDLSRLNNEISTLLERNQMKDGYFRYNVSAGVQPLGLPVHSYTDVTEALFIKELAPTSGEKRLTTLNLRRNTPEGSVRFKSHHYLNNILARKEAPHGVEGVFLTKEGFIAEGIVSNLFFIRDSTLYTPAVEAGILNGVTRQFVIELAKDAGVRVKEGFFTLEFAQQADEVFITNSIQEIVPVRFWDHVEYGVHGEGSLSKKLLEQYRHRTIKGNSLHDGQFS